LSETPDITNEEPKEVTISEFRPYLNRFRVVFKVIGKEDVVEVQNRDNPDEKHQMSNIKIADTTGSVILTAWDNDIELLEEGKYYSLTNGYVNLYRDSMRLARGKFGEFAEVEDNFEPNLQVDRSEEKHQRRQRRNNFRKKEY
jgi:ssDNA-binding replication factor A large subunit